MSRALTVITALLLAVFAERTAAQQMVMSVPAQQGGRESAVAVDSLCLTVADSCWAELRMCVQLLGSRLPRGRVVSVVPRLVSERDSADFPAVELYGRWAHLAMARSGVDDDAAALHVRARDAYSSFAYARAIECQPWMRYAQLKLVVTMENGCRDVMGRNERYAFTGDMALRAHQPVSEQPTAATAAAETYVAPVAQPNLRSYNGTAYIDYPLSQTAIYPDYHDNHRRLDAIGATLDSVLHGDHSLIQHISLRGYASPEGSYAVNERLARGRVASLRRYIIDTFGVPDILITADYEPEDWEGLRRHVAASTLAGRDALLSIIDSPLHPDAKLARIAATYPDVYHELLRDVFPYLRRTDYRIDYIIGQAAEPTAAEPADAPLVATVEHATATTAAAATYVDDYSAVDTSVLPLTMEQTYSNFRTYRPLFALKTNLLFDAALAPNVELELPLGRKARWSLMAEVWCPWWRFGHNPQGERNSHYRADQRPTRTAYELLAVGGELRWWPTPRCAGAHPVLAGTFVGVYAAGGHYDLGRHGKGNQGEYTSIGLSAGYAWPLSRHFSLELSAAAGYVGGPKVHYANEFDDTHLIYRYNNRFRYLGPTKLKLSIGWLIGRKSRKGGVL